jgi:hypothetical protein
MSPYLPPDNLTPETLQEVYKEIEKVNNMFRET